MEKDLKEIFDRMDCLEQEINRLSRKVEILTEANDDLVKKVKRNSMFIGEMV